MTVEWDEIKSDAFITMLTSGEHRHIGFLVGSFVSCGQPSSCLSVGDVRRETIAAILRATEDNPGGYAARKLLVQIEHDLSCGSGASWYDVLRDLPFEQFMACVEHGSPESAGALASLLCGTGRPNSNHEAISKIASRVLERDLADTVTIVTTNYDICLDEALRETFGEPVDSGQQPTTPLLPLREFTTERGSVRYLKIHGCLRIPTTLVFSFGQMLRLLASQGWENAVLDRLGGPEHVPSLALTVGYGFGDRDLDLFLSRWFQAAHIFRNDPYLTLEQRRTPTQFLQGEFFEQVKLRQRHRLVGANDECSWSVLRTPLLSNSDEHGATSESVLQETCRALSLPRLPLPPPLDGSHDQRHFDAVFADVWSLESTAKFLGRLCHSAERTEGRRVTYSLLGGLETTDARVNVAHEYLRSIGIRDARQRGVTCARMLRRRRTWQSAEGLPGTRSKPWRLPRDVRAIAWAYESFMVSLMVGQAGSSKIKKVRLGLRALLADRLGWLNGLNERHVQPIRAEYSTHFWVKGIQQVPVPGLQRVLIRSMRRRVDGLAVGDDLDQYGDATALLAELLIHARKEDGMVWAARARRLRTIIGRYSNAAQGDRLLGWGHLSQGDSRKAVVAFGRGLLLVLGGEPGVERKLGANLARVPWSVAQSWLRELEPVTVHLDRIRSAVDRIVDDASTPTSEATPWVEGVERRADEWAIVFQHVLHTFEPNCVALVAELDEHQDTSQHYIYYPHCEPRG